MCTESLLRGVLQHQRDEPPTVSNHTPRELCARVSGRAWLSVVLPVSREELLPMVCIVSAADQSRLALSSTSYCIPCQPEYQRRLPLRCWQRSEKEMPLHFVHAASDGPIAITRGLWEGGQHHRKTSLRCRHVSLPAWRLISDRCQSTANAHPRLPVPNPLCRPAG